MRPFIPKAPIDKPGGKYSSNAWEGSGEWASGPSTLFRTHIMSFTLPGPCLHPLSLTGNRRQARGGNLGQLGPGPELRAGEGGTQVPVPGWILWTLPEGLMGRQRMTLEDSRNPKRPAVTCSDSQAVQFTIMD